MERDVSGRKNGEVNGQTQSEGGRRGCRGGADWAGGGGGVKEKEEVKD